jgi:RNA recognition motif-containing protein
MNNILVGNLAPDATEQDVRSVFEQHGTVERFKLMTDRKTGQPSGFAFLEMSNDAEAEKAIAALNGKEVKGRTINVNEARPQLHRGARPKVD